MSLSANGRGGKRGMAQDRSFNGAAKIKQRKKKSSKVNKRRRGEDRKREKVCHSFWSSGSAELSQPSRHFSSFFFLGGKLETERRGMKGVTE